MSGGEYDYAFGKVNAFINDMRASDLSPKRRAFKMLLNLVSDAMYRIEWVDSGDFPEGDENASIDAVFQFLSPSPDDGLKVIAFDMIERLLINMRENGEKKC